MKTRRSFATVAILSVLVIPEGARAQVAFPQEITDPAGTIVIYQPQPEKLVGNVLTGRAAMSVRPAGTSEPVFGAFWFTSMIDAGDDTVVLRDIKVTRVRWPESDAAAEAKFTRIVNAAAAKANITLAREQLSASLASADREQKSLASLRNDPPKFVFSDKLSVLLLYDGAPRWSDVEGSAYERAINTAFLVVRDKRSKTCYLSNGRSWYSASSALGPWMPAAQAPADLAKMIPPADEETPELAAPPAVVVATEPTELVVSDGVPKWAPVGEGALLYVQNTETPWVRELATGKIYLLVSGRWFRATSLSGPWEFVRPDQLPGSFAKIPSASDIGGVRVSVAGTDEAEDAVLDAEIPETAAINRSEATLDVQYEGTPKFERIPGTSVSNAVNTPTQVLQIGSKYYAVDDGVWFASASATGPWAVADRVPEDEIAKIPPSSPVYNVTHVHVYQSTPDVVYVGYTPGYLWSFPYYGVPVYGTGFYYPPYPGFYYPRPVTYGLHVGYNPWTGWNFGMSWSSGFMRVSVGWGGGYRGPWRRYPGRCCGGFYGGGRPVLYGGRTRINVGSINIGNNVNFGNQKAMVNRLRSRPSDGRFERPNLYRQPETRARIADRSALPRDARQPKTARGVANDVFADRQGNVVRQTPNGLQTRDRGKWQNADRPAAGDRARPVDRATVQRDSRARQHGAERAQRTGSPRPSPPAARRRR